MLSVLGLTTATLFASVPSQAAHTADRIIAVVNNEVITLSELKAQTQDEERHLREQYRGEELERRRRQIEYTALTRMIERKLQMQRAKDKGVDVTEEELKTALQALQRQGRKLDTSDPNDKNSVKEQLILLKVVDREVRSGVMVSEAELQRYYEQHISRFMLPEEYRISQILIRPHASERRAEGRARAAEIFTALQQGADFAELALRRSDGSEASRGGSLGFVRQGELLAPIERAIVTLEVGRFSEPVETPEGFHIIRLDEKKPPQFRPFAEVKVEIQNLVYRQKSEDVYQLWIADLKNKAYIEVKF